MVNGGDDGCEEKELGWRPRAKLNSFIIPRPFFSSHLQDNCALQRTENESTHRLCDFAHHRTAI
ncbi:hypothetical protein BYT27DRAFT_7194548 [Phlegmacium glaucopus]|nr:hypothetical protein BYT27DRAFT_7194548 [Phlegmacium glaucopus]